MASSNAFAEGGIKISTSNTSIQASLSLESDAAVPSIILQTENMPHLTLYLQQTSGATAAQYTFQYSVSTETGLTPRWLDIQPTGTIPLGTTMRQEFYQPAKVVRVTVTRASGVASAVTYAITAASS